LPDTDGIDATPGVPQPPAEIVLDQFVACFVGLEDPRTGNAGLHDFHELLMIALCAVLCGGQSATHMPALAKARGSIRGCEGAIPPRHS
jgi:DDE_Tnp_1-associated